MCTELEARVLTRAECTERHFVMVFFYGPPQPIPPRGATATVAALTAAPPVAPVSEEAARAIAGETPFITG